MISIYGQENLKTITEDFQEGKATYQYYEDQTTGNFVKHGTFKYVKQQGSYAETATGTFNKGMRNGVWTYKISGTDYPNSMGSYTTRTMNATLTYKNGMPDGLWKLTDFSKARSKMLAPHNTFRWSDYETITDDNVSMTFKNGVAVGTVTHKNKGKVITYTLNELGYATGTHNLNRYIGTETIVYKDGVVVKDIVRDASGKIIDSDSFILEDEEKWLAVAKQYMNGEIAQADVFKLGADIFEKELSESVDVEVAFQHDYLYLKGIGGDKTLKERSSFTTRNYGKYVVVKPIGIVHYYDHPVWKNSTTIFGSERSDYLVAQYMVNNCSTTLYPEDILKLKEMIQKYDEIEQVKINETEYDKCLSQIDEAIKIWEENTKRTKCEDIIKELHSASGTNEIVNCIYNNWHVTDYINSIFDKKYAFERKKTNITKGDVSDLKMKLETINTELEHYYFVQTDSAINNIKRLVDKVNEVTNLLSKKNIYQCYKSLMIEHIYDSKFDNGKEYNTALKLTNRLIEMNKKEYDSVIKRVKSRPSLKYKIIDFLAKPESMRI